MTPLFLTALTADLAVVAFCVIKRDYQFAGVFAVTAAVMVLVRILEVIDGVGKDLSVRLANFQAVTNADTLSGVSQYATALEDRVANALDVDYGTFNSTRGYRDAVHAALKGESDEPRPA
jgi:hypothetical protein